MEEIDILRVTLFVVIITDAADATDAANAADAAADAAADTAGAARSANFGMLIRRKAGGFSCSGVAVKASLPLRRLVEVDGNVICVRRRSVFRWDAPLFRTSGTGCAPRCRRNGCRHSSRTSHSCR